MLSPRLRRLRHMLLILSLLGMGLWLAGSAIVGLAGTAIFVHEAVVVPGTVIDVRQKPFESWAETLGNGNLSWPGDVSYQPHVQFLLPGGHHVKHHDLVADNVDYDLGQQVSIISPPSRPGAARLYSWKILWGADCLRLGAGSLFTLVGYALLHLHRGKRPSAAPGKQKAPTKKAPVAKQTDSAPAKRPRQRKSPSGTPRRKKESPGSGEAAPRKPRRSRKKKAEEQTPELPL